MEEGERLATVFWMAPCPLPVHLVLLSRGCLCPGGIFSARAMAEGTGRTSRNAVLDILLSGTRVKYSSVTHGSVTFSICPFQQWVLREEGAIPDMKLKLNLLFKKIQMY